MNVVDAATVPDVQRRVGGHEASARFVRDAHAIVRDLLVPDLRRYWTDFVVTLSIMYVALATYLTAPSWSWLQFVALTVCAVTIFRVVVFTHEIAHRPTGFRAFGFVWNALAGVPLLLPSFLYGDHKGHHTNHSYGTSGDPEYLVKSAHSPGRRLLFLLLAFVYPVLPVFRFLVLTPLALVSRRLDRLIWSYASSLYVMNEMYRRDVDRGAAAASRWTQELTCAAWAWTLMILIARGALPPGTTLRLYLVTVSWMFINQLRTLASHRYGNESGAGMSALEQVLDTNTFAGGRVLPNLWAPLGLRYHALHHLLPSLPYHAMPEAHRRLVAALPASSPYHQTLKRGLWSALVLPAGATSPDAR